MGENNPLSLSEIFENPQRYLVGKNPEQILEEIGGVPEGFQVLPGLGKTVPGWRMNDGHDQLRWNYTEGPDHPDKPVWTSSYRGRITKVEEAGWWPNGPSEYTGDFMPPTATPTDGVPCDCVPEDPNGFPIPGPDDPILPIE